MTRTITESQLDRLKQVMPGGVNSPVRSGVSTKQAPMIVKKAKGDTLTDVDGETFIDFCCSWGAIILGHADDCVLDAVKERASNGTTFGITCEREGDLAEEIISAVPSVERVRFVSSGTEATMTAARLARGFTERDTIVKFTGHYHGHADQFLVEAGSGVLGLNSTSSSAGVPESAVKNTVCLSFNDKEKTEQFLREQGYRIAGVILEPVAGNMGVVPAEQGFLQMLREVTSEIGALLIFDEVMTGFRVALGGAQELYGITPDLTCFGKVIGGGFPAAAIGGKTEIMEYLAPQGRVYQAGTLSGNPVAMEAGYQTFCQIKKPGFYEDLERKANIITKPVAETIERLGINGCVQQSGSMFTIFFGKEKVLNMEDAKELDTDQFARFFQYCFRSGIYPPPSQYESWFLSRSHTDQHIEKARDVIIEALERSVL